MKPLTRDQAQGTMTFHLPLLRGAEIPPEMTLVVRRVATDRWHAGISICSRGDTFTKRLGRKLAFDRLHGGRHLFIDDKPSDLLGQIEDHLDLLCGRRPYALGSSVLNDLCFLDETLQKMKVG